MINLCAFCFGRVPKQEKHDMGIVNEKKVTTD